MNAPIDKAPTNARLSHAQLAPAAPAAPAPAMPVAQPPAAEMDIGAMIRRIFAHWQVVIVTLALGGLITSQVVRSRVPSFKSETVIFYREGIGKTVTGANEPGGVDIRQLGTKLKETLLAQQTLRQVIDEFHLYPDTVAKAGYADAVDQMRKKADFKSRSQDTFAISFEGTDRDQAQKVCARMAEILIKATASRLAEDQRSTTEFLVVEKRRADEELDRTEREISEFLAAHPEFITAKEALGAEASHRQKEAEAAESRRRRPSSGGGSRSARRGKADPVSPAPGPTPGAAAGAAQAVDPVLISARTQAMTELMNARKDLADKASRFTDKHPDVKAAESRVELAEQAVQRAEEAIAAARPKEEAAPPPRKVVNIDDPYGGEDAGAPKATASSTAAASPDDEKDKEKEKPKLPSAERQEKGVSLEVEWSRLQRMLGIVRVRQADLESRLYKAELAASTNESGYGSTIAVLDPAYKPSTPSNAPNKTVVMIGLAASVVVGLVLSAAWGLFLDDRVFSPVEIETIVMVPVLGAVPKDTKKGKKKGKADKSVDKRSADAKAAINKARAAAAEAKASAASDAQAAKKSADGARG
ncbi:MAG: hypothetical protein QM820_58055 [Minicystis sp.]